MSHVAGIDTVGVKPEDSTTRDEVMSHCESTAQREIASLYFTMMKVRAMNAARRNIEAKHS